MASVHQVAKWFLSKDSMAHKKLQKLCYYGQAWHCALLNAPLFDERIEAWIHGPVIPELYATYAGYGWQPIPKEATAPSFEENTLSILNSVYDTYNEFSGDELEGITHSEEPWIKARGDLKPWEPCTEVITCSSMSEYYKKLYAQAQND